MLNDIIPLFLHDLLRVSVTTFRWFVELIGRIFYKGTRPTIHYHRGYSKKM